MKKLLMITPILLFGILANAESDNLLGQASETIKEGVQTAGETIKKGVHKAGEMAGTVVGKAERSYERVVQGSLHFTNSSQEPVFISLESNGESYQENGMETFEVKPGDKLSLSPDLTKDTKFHISKEAEQKHTAELPKTNNVDLNWNGTSFVITQKA